MAIAPVAAAFMLLAFAQDLNAETLSDAIALAYQTNPTLQGQRASQRALDETFVQAEAGYRPTIGVQAGVTTDANNLGAFNPHNFAPGNSQSSEAVVTLNQPLYTGGLVSAQVRAARAKVIAGREQLRNVEETVLQQVIDAYIDVRRDQQGLLIGEDSLKLLERQLIESKARFEVGEITRTDVAETEARVAGARAQLASAQAQLAISRAAYDDVVGHDPGDLAPEPSLERLLPASLASAYALAEQANPQILQADYTERSSAAQIAAAKAQARPTLSLQGQAGYYGGNFGGVSPFVDYTHDVNASVVLKVPIFTGGIASSQIRQAAENNNVDRISIEATRRKVLLTVAQAWNQLLAARADLLADETQVRASNIAFEGSRQEAEVGLRTTLDVLITEQDLAAAQLALVAARHDEYAAAAALLAAEGDLYAQDLSDVTAYDPKKNFDRVRKMIGWPLDPVISTIDEIGSPGVPPPPPGR
ncbi:MAG: TolC family outer membrane protein [Caulobacteraceae bacterium]